MENEIGPLGVGSLKVYNLPNEVINKIFLHARLFYGGDVWKVIQHAMELEEKDVHRGDQCITDAIAYAEGIKIVLMEEIANLKVEIGLLKEQKDLPTAETFGQPLEE